jgi:phage tail sheath protein FI
MPEYLAPGVYVEEVRGDVVPIQGVSTSTAGFVGPTERGPAQTILVTSWPEFLRWYGGTPDPSASASALLPWAIQGFFANGGQRAFIARATGTGAATAALTLSGNAAPAVTARGPGEWGNRVLAWVRRATKSADRFRLQVAYFAPGVTIPSSNTDIVRAATALEDYDELSVNPKDARYATGVVNSASQLVSLAWADDGPTAPQPGPFAPLTGGTEGTDLDATSFVGDPADPPDQLTGLAALAAVDEIAILAVPDAVNPALDAATQDAVVTALLDQCELLRDRVAVLDVPRGAGNITSNLDDAVPRRSDYAAIYYPHVRMVDPRSRATVLVPPSGFVAGLYAFNDETRGVHKAPANYEVRGILTRDLTPTEGPLEYVVTKGQQDILNPFGINVIRDFRASGRGIRVWGARTISADPEWIYVNVRRLFNFVEESVDEGLQWVVFEPNAEPTWARVRRTIETFLERVWRDGALMGTTREEAFFVRCDRTTMTSDDILNGRLICLVGLAAVRPAEFVILRFSQMTVEATN